MKLSAVVLTKNEEKNIKDCLEGLSFCDEIIIVDDFSQDKTREIAEKEGAKVFKKRLEDDFSAQRNFGLEKAGGDWVLFVDADERVSPQLATEIKEALTRPVSGFYLRRLDFMWGKSLEHGETGNVKLLRLGRRDAGKWRRRVHEVWEVSGQVETLKNPLHHYPHPTLREFIADVERFSSLHAQVNYEEGVKSSLLKITVWPAGHFFKNWVLRLGFLDGLPGFMVASVMSFHSFLAWSKLWLKQKR